MDTVTVILLRCCKMCSKGTVYVVATLSIQLILLHGGMGLFPDRNRNIPSQGMWYMFIESWNGLGGMDI